jgi:hypothetical protein
MHDRFTAGLISGFLAGVAGFIFELVLVGLFHFGDLAFLRFAGIMIYFHAPQNLAEQIVAALVAFLFSSYLGAAYAYFLVAVSDRHDILKGVIWGLIIAFVIWTVTFLFRARPEASTPENAVANDLSAVVYGLTLALSYRLLRSRPAVNDPGVDQKR